MKAISDYTIFCTEEQTRKALEVGAPIKATFLDIPNKFKYQGCDVEIPTAEQMISWLENLGGIEEITVCKTGMWIWGKNHILIDSSSNCSSRKESSLAAIDAALKYLEIRISDYYDSYSKAKKAKIKTLPKLFLNG